MDGTQAFAPWVVYMHFHHGWYTGIFTMDGIQAFSPWMVYMHFHHGWYTGIFTMDCIQAFAPWMVYRYQKPQIHLSFVKINSEWSTFHKWLYFEK